MTSGGGKLKMALHVMWRYSWFCLFFLALLGLDVSFSNSGKEHVCYVVGLLFCYQECRYGRIQVHNFSFKLMFTQGCSNEWLMYVGVRVQDSEPNGN